MNRQNKKIMRRDITNPIEKDKIEKWINKHRQNEDYWQI